MALRRVEQASELGPRTTYLSIPTSSSPSLHLCNLPSTPGTTQVLTLSTGALLPSTSIATYLTYYNNMSAAHTDHPPRPPDPTPPPSPDAFRSSPPTRRTAARCIMIQNLRLRDLPPLRVLHGKTSRTCPALPLFLDRPRRHNIMSPMHATRFTNPLFQTWEVSSSSYLLKIE